MSFPEAHGGNTDRSIAIRAHLDRILASESFSRAGSLSRLLGFLVHRTLDGQAEQLKEYTLGVEVFDRGESFDPRLDTIVRVQARKLRAKLEKYYQIADPADGLRIELTPGSYVPEFREFDPSGETTGKTQLDLTPGPLREIRRWPWLAAGASAAASIGILAWLMAQPRQSVPAPAPRPVPLTSFVGSERQPSLSPDSRQVAFSWDGDRQDNFDIYIQQIGSGGVHRLTSNPAADTWPAWSPDSRWIAFQRQETELKVEVLIIPALGGGPERKIGEVSGRPEHMGMSWSLDSQWLAVTDCPVSQPCSLWLLSPANQPKRQLTFPPANLYGDHAPAFSPDGRTLGFVRMSGPRSGEVFLLSLSGDLRPLRNPTPLTQENGYPYQLSWASDGKTLLLVYGKAAVDLSLWKVGILGSRKPEQIPGIEGLVDAVAVGRHLVYASATGDSNVWRVSVPGGESHSFLASTRVDMMAEYSPDGRSIAFVSNRSGIGELWVCDASGGNPIALTSFGGRPVGIPSWSPDGQQIVFYGSPQGQADIFIMSSSGGSPRRLTTEGGFFPRFSRDGNWIYFGSSRAGAPQVWKLPAGGGPAQQVTRHGGSVAAESADGRYLYYSAWNGLWRMPLAGGDEEKVLDGLASNSTFQVSQHGIYWIARETGGGFSVRFLDFHTRRTKTITHTQGPLGFHLSVSPDQRWLLYTQVEQAGSDLMLVENYRP